MSHLHQTGHPGLVLLLSGRRRRRRRRRTPSASLRASPRGRSGRTPPLPIGADCASSPPRPRPRRQHPSRRPRSWALRDPGRARLKPCGLGAEAELPGVGPLPWGAAWRDQFPRRIFCRGRGCQVCGLPGTGAAPAERVAAAAASGRALVSDRGGRASRARSHSGPEGIGGSEETRWALRSGLPGDGGSRRREECRF